MIKYFRKDKKGQDLMNATHNVMKKVKHLTHNLHD